MGRNLRQDPIDGWHHITNHAVGKEALFINDRDRHQFLRRLNESADRHGVDVLAFCLMGNHFHLVLRCPQQGLSPCMHYLESIYAREFNVRHARRGALLRRNFHNKLITDEGQALATIRYVHRNPLELGIDIRSYPWSSYRAYAYNDPSFFRPDPSVTAELLGGSSEHRSYVEQNFPHDNHRFAEGQIVVHSTQPVSIESSVRSLLEIVSDICAVAIEEIVATRARVRNDARSAATLITAESRTGFTEELRSVLGYQSAGAMRNQVKRARERTKLDPEFASLVAQIRRRWSVASEPLAS